MNRPDFDTYFMGIARAVATRGSCDRLQVGSVLVHDLVQLASGYNGAPRGMPHCGEVGHQLDAEDHCTTAVHAEANAITQAAREGVRIVGATLYTTAVPCWPCFRLCINAGVAAVYYAQAYKLDPRVEAAAARLYIELLPLKESEHG